MLHATADRIHPTFLTHARVSRSQQILINVLASERVMKMYGFALLSVCALLAGHAYGSAIPMWEFLGKDEKMSFLYNMFENQVHDYCESIGCKQELLKYGLRRLKAMPEEHLDKMDPYQRGSNDIIWASMMEGHAMLQTTKSPKPDTTAKPNSFDDESFGDDFGSQGAASAKIETVYKVAPPKGFAYPQPQRADDQQTNRKTNAYPSTNAIQEPTGKIETIDTYDEYASNPLSGPSVVRVYPDGTPVEEEEVVPQDEDLRLYRLSQMQLPNL